MLFLFLSLWMTEEDSIYDKVTICEWIANAGLDTTVSNITLPFFFYHYDEWWYIMYQYILEADESMKVYAYLLTPVFPIVFLVLVVLHHLIMYYLNFIFVINLMMIVVVIVVKFEIIEILEMVEVKLIVFQYDI